MKSPHLLAAAVLGSLLLGAAACGGGEVSVFSPPPDESYSTEQVEAGRAVYERYCTSCHRGDGSGGVGTNIRQVWERMSFDEEVAVITDGRRQMPKFAETLTEEEIDDVVAFTRVGW